MGEVMKPNEIDQLATNLRNIPDIVEPVHVDDDVFIKVVNIMMNHLDKSWTDRREVYDTTHTTEHVVYKNKQSNINWLNAIYEKINDKVWSKLQKRYGGDSTICVHGYQLSHVTLQKQSNILKYFTEEVRLYLKVNIYKEGFSLGGKTEKAFDIRRKLSPDGEVEMIRIQWNDKLSFIKAVKEHLDYILIKNKHQTEFNNNIKKLNDALKDL